MVKTPASLLERLRRPEDQQAWERFLRLYGPMIYAWACRAGLEGNDAADLTQDVFVILVRKLPEFRYDCQRSFRAWLKTVTLNRWRERLRGLPVGLRRTLGDDVPDPEGCDVPAGFEEAEYRREILRRAMALIRRDFQPTTWNVWREHVMVGRPAAEVAAQFDVTVNAVYLTKSRVLRRLREEFHGLLE